jgi:hypothetical protein
LSSQVLEPSGKENDKEKSFVIYREREREQISLRNDET